MTKRAVIYARVATEDSDLHGQAQAAERYARERGWQIVETIMEKDEGENTESDGLSRLRELVHGNAMDVVVVKSLKRFAEENDALAEIAHDLRAAGIEIETVKE